MKVRLGSLAALFALLGLLTVSVGEAWAAVCLGSGGETRPAVHTASHGQPCHPAETTVRDQAELPGGTSSEVPHCPAMPVGAASACGVVVALPVDSSSWRIASTPEARVSPHLRGPRALLMGAAFFRPPIA